MLQKYTYMAPSFHVDDAPTEVAADIKVMISALHANGAASSPSTAAAKKAEVDSAYYASLLLQEAMAPIRKAQVQKRFGGAMVLLSCAFVGLLLGLSQYTTFEEQPQAQIDQYYQYLMHVNIMVGEGGGPGLPGLMGARWPSVCLPLAADHGMNAINHGISGTAR